MVATIRLVNTYTYTYINIYIYLYNIYIYIYIYNIYIYKITTLYTLNIHNDLCQFYLIKAGEEKDTSETKGQ